MCETTCIMHCDFLMHHMNLTFLECENNWLEFGGHCYILLEKKSSWAEARVKKNVICKLDYFF